jgi:hypothetical protein
MKTQIQSTAIMNASNKRITARAIPLGLGHISLARMKTRTQGFSMHVARYVPDKAGLSHPIIPVTAGIISCLTKV